MLDIIHFTPSQKVKQLFNKISQINIYLMYPVIKNGTDISFQR